MSLHLLVGYKDGQNIVSCSEGKLLCCSQFVTPHAIIGCTTTLWPLLHHRYTHIVPCYSSFCLQYAKPNRVFPSHTTHYNDIRYDSSHIPSSIMMSSDPIRNIGPMPPQTTMS